MKRKKNITKLIKNNLWELIGNICTDEIGVEVEQTKAEHSTVENVPQMKNKRHITLACVSFLL